MTISVDDKLKVRQLNDEFRESRNFNVSHGVWIREYRILFDIVQKFSHFNDDPKDEHEFGRFELDGEKFIWEIDYFDKSYVDPSLDRRNPDITARVLTIMLESEYPSISRRKTVFKSIAELNDEFRKDGGFNITAGVFRLDTNAIANAVKIAREFNSFHETNPEHDFGAFKSDGLLFYWSIGYLDTSYTHGSPDRKNPNVTRRVLTIMLAEEY